MTSAVVSAEGRLFRGGWAQGLAALAVAGLTAAVIAVPHWADNETAGRLAIAGAVVFGVALGLGSSRVIGASSAPVLVSAFITSATSDETLWGQSIVVGCLWYIAVELAWESVDRRTQAKRSGAIGIRRVHEVTIVVATTLAVTGAAYAASSLGAARTLGRQSLVVGALFVAIVIAVRHIAATTPAGRD